MASAETAGFGTDIAEFYHDLAMVRAAKQK